MLDFDLTFCKVYIYAKGWPGIDLGASHESCTHPNTYVRCRGNTEKFAISQNLEKIHS